MHHFKVEMLNRNKCLSIFLSEFCRQLSNNLMINNLSLPLFGFSFGQVYYCNMSNMTSTKGIFHIISSTFFSKFPFLIGLVSPLIKIIGKETKRVVCHDTAGRSLVVCSFIFHPCSLEIQVLLE